MGGSAKDYDSPLQQVAMGPYIVSINQKLEWRKTVYSGRSVRPEGVHWMICLLFVGSPWPPLPIIVRIDIKPWRGVRGTKQMYMNDWRVYMTGRTQPPSSNMSSVRNPSRDLSPIAYYLDQWQLSNIHMSLSAGDSGFGWYDCAVWRLNLCIPSRDIARSFRCALVLWVPQINLVSCTYIHTCTRGEAKQRGKENNTVHHSWGQCSKIVGHLPRICR